MYFMYVDIHNVYSESACVVDTFICLDYNYVQMGSHLSYIIFENVCSIGWNDLYDYRHQNCIDGASGNDIDHSHSKCCNDCHMKIGIDDYHRERALGVITGKRN